MVVTNAENTQPFETKTDVVVGGEVFPKSFLDAYLAISHKVFLEEAAWFYDTVRNVENYAWTTPKELFDAGKRTEGFSLYYFVWDYDYSEWNSVHDVIGLDFMAPEDVENANESWEKREGFYYPAFDDSHLESEYIDYKGYQTIRLQAQSRILIVEYPRN